MAEAPKVKYSEEGEEECEPAAAEFTKPYSVEDKRAMLRTVFDLWDTNKNGSLDENEVAAATGLDVVNSRSFVRSIGSEGRVTFEQYAERIGIDAMPDAELDQIMAKPTSKHAAPEKPKVKAQGQRVEAGGGETPAGVDAELLAMLCECRLERRESDIACRGLGSLEALLEQLKLKDVEALASDFESQCAWPRIDVKKFEKLCDMAKAAGEKQQDAKMRQEEEKKKSQMVKTDVGVSKYDANYYCEVKRASVVTESDRTMICIEYHVHGDGSLGPLQDPSASKLWRGTTARTAGGDLLNVRHELGMQEEFSIVGSLYYDVGAEYLRHPHHFEFGEAGYSTIEIPPFA